MRKLGDTITFDFTTHNPSIGMVQDADSLPTCEVFEDDNDTSILTPVVTKRSGKTGDYRVSIEATTPNGFEVGKTYNAIASATVNSISAKSRIGIFVLDSKRNADLQDLSAVQVWGYGTRALTTFGSLVSDIVVAVWGAVTRTLTSGTKDSEIDAIKAKTDLIDWTDITAIKNKTDTIDWSNVLAIKTKTDTIDWADIYSIIIVTGEIKAKTDVIDWADVLAIKTETDTILWTDVIEIKTKTDQLNFTVPGRVDATASGGGGGLTPEEHDQVMMIESIKDKTDQLTFTVAGRVDATSSGGGGGLTPEEHDNVMMIEGARDHILEIYALYGLDPTKPLIVTPTLRQAGTIFQKITTKPKEVKVERQ